MYGFMSFVSKDSTSLAVIVQQYRYINGDGGAGYGYKDGGGWLFDNRWRDCIDYRCNQETVVESGKRLCTHPSFAHHPLGKLCTFSLRLYVIANMYASIIKY